MNDKKSNIEHISIYQAHGRWSLPRSNRKREREIERGVIHQCPNLSHLFQFAINFDPQYNSCPNL